MDKITKKMDKTGLKIYFSLELIQEYKKIRVN